MITQTLFDLPFVKNAARATVNGPTVDPTSFSGLTLWLRAEDLSALGEGGRIGTGSNSWFDHINSSISASQPTATSRPYYLTTNFAGGKAGVHFTASLSQGLTLNRTFLFPTEWTCQVLFKGNGTDSIIMGNPTINSQLRRFRSGANNMSAYGGGADIASDAFSSSISQSVVLTWIASGSFISMYEGIYIRKPLIGMGPDQSWNTIGYTSFGGFATGSIAEICMWSGSLSSSLINIYNNYWKVKYSSEIFYG